METSESNQKTLFDSIAREYHEHFDDAWGAIYRREFMHNPMFEGVELAGRRVLEAMCGGGSATDFLMSRNSRVVGIDLSFPMLQTFRSRSDISGAVQGTVLKCAFKDSSFDCVVVQGGLHHIQPFVREVVGEIHRILKPGGYFCFSEPHAWTLPDLARRVWYKVDPYFARNEEAVNIGLLIRENRERFEIKRTVYAGNIAYLLIYNSLIFRIPHLVKKKIAPALMCIERVLAKLQTSGLSCFAVCQWRKK